MVFRVMELEEDQDFYVGEVKFADWNTLGSLLDTIQLENGFLRGKISLADSLTHVGANLPAESSVLAL